MTADRDKAWEEWEGIENWNAKTVARDAFFAGWDARGKEIIEKAESMLVTTGESPIMEQGFNAAIRAVVRKLKAGDSDGE